MHFLIVSGFALFIITMIAIVIRTYNVDEQDEKPDDISDWIC